MESFSVGLDIQHDKLREAFEKIIAPQKDFHLHAPEEADPPHLLILEIEDDPATTFSVVRTILSTSPTTDICLTAPSTDAGMLLEALRMGVKEFIPQPIQQAEVEQALQRFQERRRDRNLVHGTGGKLINILGSKGGVGCTTIAVNLAISLLASNKNASVVLVDLNPQLGDVALFLDLEPTHTVGDIAQNPARLDATFLLSILSQHASGLHVLPAAPSVEDDGLLTPRLASMTLELLQRSFDYVVIDSGQLLDDITLTVLNMSTVTFLISTLTLHVLQNTKRLLNALSQLEHVKEKIHLVFNKYNAKAGIPLKDIEGTFDKRPFWLVPDDYSTVATAINTGTPIPLMHPRGDMAKSFKRLVAALEPKPVRRRTFFLPKLLKLG